ncbi:MAG: insulinase family protein, partial [Gemmatimonadetes bacterium]|nr:insulinase family protein [Gemmatimonadota bacterium]
LAAGSLGAQEHVVVRAEPGTPVVAVEVMVATGPSDEGEEQAGLAYLTARAAMAPIRPVLDSLGAHLDVEAHKDALAFTLTAAPDVWQEASRTLLVALFRDPVDSVATLRERRAIQAELVGREASPADAIVREVDAAVFGPKHPWGRPAVGSSSTVGKLTLADVDAFIRANLVPERTAVAIVGPVDPVEARQPLAVFFQGVGWQRSETTPAEPLESPIRQEYNSITTWVAASWHLPPDADLEALRLLADLASERLSFGPSRRSVYNAMSEVIRRADGGELRLQLVVKPEEVEAWAGRIRESVAAYAESPMAELVFRERLRRFRGERLRELDSPETRAQLVAQELLLRGRTTAGLVEVDGLTPDRLFAAAKSLGTPTFVFLGPFLDSST